ARAHADDRRSRRAEQEPEQGREPPPQSSAVTRAERGEKPERAHGETRAERPDVDEAAARHHQPADRGQRHRRHVCRGSDRRGERGGDGAVYQPAGGMTYTRASSGPKVSEKPESLEATAGPVLPRTVAERPAIPSTSILAVTVEELVFTAIT